MPSLTSCALQHRNAPVPQRPRSSWMLLAVALVVGCAADARAPQPDDANALPRAPTDGELLEGMLRPFVADHADGTHDIGYTLVTASGERVGLAFKEPVTLSSANECLWYEGFNDALSSMRIRALGTTP